MTASLIAMKRYIVLALMALCISSCEDTDLLIMTDAASDAVKAITLSDEDIRELALQAARESDSAHTLAPPGSSYDRRIGKLVGKHDQRDGYSLNFKVYLADDINAFAMADGSVRVCSGLMDLMNDKELLFVIGHEIGHVVKNHSRQKVVLAYGSSALRKVLASQNNELGQIARSVVGAFAHQLTNAQFSQYEERQADQYGVSFLEEGGYDRSAAVSALVKLDALAKQHTFLSSHPDPGKRAELVAQEENIDDENRGSLLKTMTGYGKQLLSMVIALSSSLIDWLLSLW